MEIVAGKGEKFVRCNYITLSEVRNVSPNQKTFQGTIFVEKTVAPVSSVLNLASETLINGDAVELVRKEGEIGSYYTFEHQVNPNETIIVEQKYAMSKYLRDSEIWRSTLVTERADITIVHPNGLRVGVDLIHPEAQTRAAKMFSNPGSVMVSINRPLLPHNGFTYWWIDSPANTSGEPALAEGPETSSL